MSSTPPLPNCAQLCVSSNYLPGCGTADITCLCKDKGFVNNVSNCICTTCSPGDAIAAYTVYAQICGLSRAPAACPSTTTSPSPTASGNAAVPLSSKSVSVTNTPSSNQKSSSLSGGIIAAIVVPTVLAFITALSLLLWFLKRRRNRQRIPPKPVAKSSIDRSNGQDTTELGGGLDTQVFQAGSREVPGLVDSTPIAEVEATPRAQDTDRSTTGDRTDTIQELESPVSPLSPTQALAGTQFPQRPQDAYYQPLTSPNLADNESGSATQSSATAAVGTSFVDSQAPSSGRNMQLDPVAPSPRASMADSVSDVFHETRTNPDSTLSISSGETERSASRQELQEELRRTREERERLERLHELRARERELEERYNSIG